MAFVVRIKVSLSLRSRWPRLLMLRQRGQGQKLMGEAKACERGLGLCTSIRFSLLQVLLDTIPSSQMLRRACLRRPTPSPHCPSTGGSHAAVVEVNQLTYTTTILVVLHDFLQHVVRDSHLPKDSVQAPRCCLPPHQPWQRGAAPLRPKTPEETPSNLRAKRYLEVKTFLAPQPS